MNAHKFASRTKIDAFQLKDFLGVDFTTHESEVNQKRSPDAINMISGKTGSVDKRNGLKLEGTRYNGRYIFPISYLYTTYFDPSRPQDGSSSSIVETLLNVHIDGVYGITVDIGIETVSKLYLMQETQSASPVSITYGMNATWYQDDEYSDKEYDRKISIARLDDYNYLLLGVPKMYLIHISDSNLGLFDTNAFWSVNGATWSGFDYNIELGYIIDLENAQNIVNAHFYIPTKEIGRSPNGTTSTSYDLGNNLFSFWQQDDFLSNGTSTNYVVSGKFRFIPNNNLYVYYKINGNWVKQTPSWSYTNVGNNGVVSFGSAPPAPSVSGEDNVRIVYTCVVENPYTNYLNWVTHSQYFGYNGNDDYLFLAIQGERGKGKRNRDYRIRLKDWFADSNSYSDFGWENSKIKGYSLYNNYLVTHTEKIGNNPTIFLRSASIDDSGEVFFPISKGSVGNGAVGNAFASLNGDTIWLSKVGINALITNNLTNTSAVRDRSFYINEQLVKEDYFDDAIGFVYDNKYFLFINNKLYIADPRKKYVENLSESDSFQYDWYYCIVPLDIISYSIIGSKLYLLGKTINGYSALFSLRNDEDDKQFIDDMVEDFQTWLSSKTFKYGNIVYKIGSGGKYYFCIKDHYGADATLTNEDYWLPISVVLDGETSYHFEIPVYAYWTTPIMNMGNITMLKTLKNLWVRLGKYAHMSTRIYYSTKGLIKEEYDGVFDFSDIDFSRFVFSSDTDPSVMVTNRQERKFMSIQFKVESRDSNPFSLLEIVGKYIVNKQYKG